jgi:hypothetical protein
VPYLWGRVRQSIRISCSGHQPRGEGTLSGIKAEDFAVALRLAYSDPPQEAAFSLDPADPKNPERPLLQKVYYPDSMLAGTTFGKQMFEADWLLK